MDMIKIVGIALTSIIIIIIIKQYKPEFALYISLLASILIMCIFMDKLGGIVSFISNFSNKMNRKSGIFKDTHQNYRNCDSNRICCTEFAKMLEKMPLVQKLIWEEKSSSLPCLFPLFHLC